MKFLVFLLLFCGQVLASSELELKLNEAYQAREDQGDLVGLAVGVITPVETLNLYYGEAKASDKAFEIGSISKTFTGIALGILVDEGKLDLTVPLSTYLPELKDSYTGNLTIVQVATHTGKLIRSLNAKATEGNLIAFLQTYKPDDKFPAYQYSNLGFAILTLIIERASHQTYEDFVQQNIFLPVGMGHSGFLSSEEVFTHIITPHDVINGITIYDVLNDLSVGSGGIYSPLSDMFKFLRLNMFPTEFPVLNQAVQICQKNRLGWDHSEGDGLQWKNGGMSGFTSFLGISAKNNSGTIVLNNTFNGRATQDMALTALGFNYPVKKQVAPSAEFKKIYLGTYYLEGEESRFEVVERNKGHLGIRIIRPDGSLDYVLKIESLDGINFKLATAWEAYEEVIFATGPETGKVTMTVKSESGAEVYYK